MTTRDVGEGDELSSPMKELTDAQNRLKESEEEFRRIINEIPVSMSIITPDGEVLLVNRKTMEIFGIEDSDIIGLNVSAIWESPAQRSEWLREIRKRGMVSDYEIGVTTLAGVHKTLLLSGLMITFEGRQCILSVHLDVTEKKQAEAALRNREEQYRAIYDNSPIAIGLYDARGYLNHVNPACLALFGVDSEEAIAGLSLFEDPNISDEGKKLLASGQSLISEQIFDFEKVRAQGLYPTSRRGIIWLSVLTTPLLTATGSVSGYLV